MYEFVYAERVAPLPSIPGVLRLRYRWNDSSDIDCFNNLYFRYSGGPPSESDAATLAGDCYTAMAAAASLWIADTQLTEAQITDLSEDSGAQAAHDAVTTGTNAGLPLSGGTAFVVGYQIARRYRGGKPRNYFCWGSSSDLLNRQTWQPAFVTSVQSELGTAIATIIGSTGGSTTITSHCNISYYSGNVASINPRTGRAENHSVPRVTPLVDTIVSLTPRPQPGSQRRRNRS